jgi:hypothetical protein
MAEIVFAEDPHYATWTHTDDDTDVTVSALTEGWFSLQVLIRDGGYTLPCEAGDACPCFPGDVGPETAEDCKHLPDQQDPGTFLSLEFASLDQLRAAFDRQVASGGKALTPGGLPTNDWSGSPKRIAAATWKIDEFVLPSTLSATDHHQD